MYKFYNSLIPLNEVWPCLSPKYFGKLPDIYQQNIITLHLWKIWVCSPWDELRSHYPIFLGVWLPFPSFSLISTPYSTLKLFWHFFKTEDLNFLTNFQGATLLEFKFCKGAGWMAVNLFKFGLERSNAKKEAWKRNLFSNNFIQNGTKVLS